MLPSPPSLAEFEAVLLAADAAYMFLWLVATWLVLSSPLLSSFLLKLPSGSFEFSSLNKHFWKWTIPLAALIRLPEMFSPLWYDETFSASIAKAPSFWQAILGDVHPPLYYMIERVFILLGDSEWILRLPSYAIGLGLIYVVYLVAKQVSDESTARLSAFLVAILPATSHYSSEARYPIVLAFVVLLALWALYAGKRKIFILAVTAAPLLHATGLIYAAALVIAAFTRGWYKTGIAAGVAGNLWTPFMLMQSSDVANGFWLWSLNPLQHILDMSVGRSQPSGVLWLLTLLPIAVLSVASLPFFFSLKRIPLVLVAIAPLAVWSIGLVFSPVYLPRALIASAIISVIAWSHGAIHSRYKVIFRALLIVGISAAWFSSAIAAIEDDSLELNEIFSYCEGYDYTYTTSTSMSVIAQYYGHGERIAWRGGNNLNQELSPATKRAMGLNIESAPPRGKTCVVAGLDYHTSYPEYRHLQFIMYLNQGELIILNSNKKNKYVVYRYG